MGYIEGIVREEMLLFPEALDDYIGEDNPVRFIDLWVDQLDFHELEFNRETPKETGRPGYDPRDMLKLYVYGYLNRIRSSRGLEHETVRNCEVMWLLKKLRPDFKTIADFRKDNRKSIKKLFREFTLLCKKLDLFGGELIGIDGSKFRAMNSSHKNYSKKKLVTLITEVDNKIETYLTALDSKDAEESPIAKPSIQELKEKLDHLKAHKEKYRSLMKEIEERNEKQISLTDPDSRSMKSGKGTEVCYNVHTSVDEKHKLIVEHKVTNEVTDHHQLSEMALKTKETLQAEKLDVVADMGYCHTNELEKCLDNHITPYVPRHQTSANTSEGLYGKERFTYNKEKDCYICPGGDILSYSFDAVEKNRHIAYYVTRNCQQCRLKPECTRTKGVRRISRLINEHILEETEHRVKENPLMMEKRKEICEHPFGTIKGWMKFGQFLTKRIENVSSEASLLFLSYNMKRVFKIVGIKNLMAVLS